MTDAVVPQAQLELSEAPRTQIDASVFQRAPRIAEGLQQLGSGAEDLADAAAKEQAQTDLQQQRVTLDANGHVQVANPANSVIVGRAGQDYNIAVQQGTVAQARSLVTQQLADAHRNNPLDVQGFTAAVQPIIDGLRSSPNLDPRVANVLAADAQDQAVAHRDNIAEQSVTTDVAMKKQAILTNIDDLNGRLRAMARQGATDTDDYKLGQAQLNDYYDALGENKLYGFSPDRIASDKAHAFDMLNGEFVVGRIDETFNRKGRAAALEAVRSGIDNNPNLDVTDAERNDLHNYAMSRLSYLSGEQASQIAALKPTIELQKQALQTGNSSISDIEVNRTITQLQSLGAVKEAEDLAGAKLVADRTTAFRNMSPDQKASVLLGAAGAGVGGPVASGVNTERGAMQYFLSKGWSLNAAAGIVGNLLPESGLRAGAVNPGDGSDGSDSIGIAQWNGLRAAALKTFAAAAGKPATDLQTQLAFVQHELETSESGAAARLRAAQTPEEAAAAFALGYERPAGFQTGDMTKVALGQDRIDQARRLAGSGGSMSPIADRAGITTVGQPFTEAEVAKNAWLETAYRQTVQIDDASQVRFAKGQFEALENSIKFTGNPSPDIVPQAAMVLQIADRYPDQLGTQATKLRAALGGERAGFAAASSPDGGATLLDQVNDLARSGNLFATSLAEHTKAGIETGRKLLAENPYEYGRQAQVLANRPVPIPTAPPTDGQPSTLSQAIGQRFAATSMMQAAFKSPPRGIFDNADLPQVKTLMTSGTIDQRLELASAIANGHAPQPILQATLRQLGDAKETQPLVVAGDLMGKNPVAAHAVLQGQQIMQTEPKFAPNKDDFPTEFEKAIPTNDLPLSVTRKTFDAGIQAYYAKLSADAGDTTGVLNDQRMATAVHDVTGGIVTWRDSKAIAPWYGATQDQFDAAVRSVTDKDLATSRGSDGVPLPAAALRPSFSGFLSDASKWRLQSAGDGKYFVFSGPDAASQRRYLQDVRGGNFVLDLGAKRAAVESMGTAPLNPFSSTPGSQYMSIPPMAGPL